LVINRNHILAAGFKPHLLFALPVAKREIHGLPCVLQRPSGMRGSFWAPDSAPPHGTRNKLLACGLRGRL